MTDTKAQEDQLIALLKTLRDQPAASTDGTRHLATPYDFLLKEPVNPDDGLLHWFCPRIRDPLVLEASIFLLRLFAYDSFKVKTWKEKLAQVLRGCAGCVRAFQDVKNTSRDTYFAAFPADVLTSFWEKFAEWEKDLILEDLKRAGYNPGDVSSFTLADLPLVTFYHLFSQKDFLEDPQIHAHVSHMTPSKPRPTLPYPLPPGLICARADGEDNIRQWAVDQLDTYKRSPLLPAEFTSAYVDAFQLLLSQTAKAFPNSPFMTSDREHLWSAVADVMPCLPLGSPTHRTLAFETRHKIRGHLCDDAPHFSSILRCLSELLKHMGRHFWDGEDSSFPQVVFESVKGNPEYAHLLTTSPNPQVHMSWLGDYLDTFRELPTWGDSLARVLELLCGEPQDDAFESVRHVFVKLAAQLLIPDQADGQVAHRQPQNLVESIGRYAGLFVKVAFSQAYTSGRWAVARTTSRDLIKSALTGDLSGIGDGIKQVCRAMYKDSVLSPLSIDRDLWDRTCSNIDPADKDSALLLLEVVAPSAHIDALNEEAFREAFKRNTNAQRTVRDINAHLQHVYRRFSEAISNFTDTSTSVASVLGDRDVVKEVIALLMSPVEDLQMAGQAFVRGAFDADGRPEAFRALFEHLPTETYAGILSFLESFAMRVPDLPEACNLSKSVVRCLTDIIDILCNSPDGLLRQDSHFKLRNSDQYSSPAANVHELWTSMTKTSTIIFKRTPAWAKTLGEAQEIREMMVTWMRDALIFGRDMVGQREVFEEAAVRAHKIVHPNSKAGSLRRDMVVALKPVLDEITRWLRLSEPELLYQSFSLLESLLKVLRSLDVKPDPEALSRLTKQLGSKDTRLDDARNARLKEIVTDLEEPQEEEDDEAEVQIIEHAPQSVIDKFSQISAAKTSGMSQNAKSAPRPAAGKFFQIPPAKTSSASISKKSTNNIPRTGGKLSEIRRAAAASQPGFTKKDIIRAPPPASSSKVVAKEGQATTLSDRSKGASVKFKHYGAKGSTSEAPSSSDDEDEEQDEPKGLAALAGLDKTPKVKKPTERRTVKMMDDRELGLRKTHQDRMNRRDDARRTTMRLKPDVSSLHRIILGWHYEQAIEGGLPPNVQSLRPTHVANTFASYQDYRRTFESLLILEAWAGLAQSKDEPRESYSIKLTSRQTVDDWTDMDIQVTDTVAKDWYLVDSDIVLIKRPDFDNSLLAKVQSYKATPNTINGSLRVLIKPGNPDPGLALNSIWILRKVFTLTTLHREYGALTGLEYFDFLQFILRPQLSKPTRFNVEEVKHIMHQHNLNEPQAQAILGALQSQDFSLIQGPPGTGKTTTICGLVKACLVKRARPLPDPTRPNEKVVLPKILVCAPSNAAIDEVASRLKEKVEHVVRVGSDKSINVSVKDISLESLIDVKLASANFGEDKVKDVGNQVRSLRAKLDSVKSTRQDKENALAQISNVSMDGRALEDEIRALKQQRTSITQQLDKLRDQQRDGTRTLDSMRRRFRTEVMQEADVICSTLSGAGHDILETFNSFEMVVIDEAAQAVELSSLIPLKYLFKRCVMVGDPQQLPPTVLSLEAKKYKYDQSLFVRLQKQRPEAVHLLSIQYRMHPEISQLPSEVFYSGRLQDGPNMADKTKQAWHTSAMFPPYCFFNVPGQETPAASGSSLVNRTEARVAAALYRRLEADFRSVDFSFRVGVVSMYRAQIMELKKVFRENFGADILGKVDFNTVDGFQGQEKDIIILSCVRASPGGTSVGFLADVRRMNVALTRARSSLFILGNANTLQRSDETWKNIVANARSRSRLVEGKEDYFRKPGQKAAPLADVPPVTKRKLATSEAPPDDLFTPRDVKKKPIIARASAPVMERDHSSGPINLGDIDMMDGTASARSSSPPLTTRSSSPTDMMETDTVPKPAPTIPSKPPKPAGNGPSKSKPPARKPKPNPAAALFIPKKKPS